MAVTNVLIDVRTSADGFRDLARRVQAEYGEMPGLSVTLPQAQRLWGADPQTCESVFMALTARGFLKRTKKGRFVRC
jgi:hypothetical protein